MINLNGVKISEEDFAAKADELGYEKVKPAQGEIDWRRVIDGGYLVRFSDESQEEANISNMIGFVSGITEDNGKRLFKKNGGVFARGYAAIYREPNHIQPHFGSAGLPEGVESGDVVSLYLRSGQIIYGVRAAVWNWSHCGGPKNIMKFIVHK